VYLADVWHAYSILANPADFTGRYFETVRVIGRHRKSAKWIGCIVRTDLVTNWRVERLHQSGALAQLKKERWAGFHLERGSFVCPDDKHSPEAIRGLLAALGVRLT
jgi:hypothetical protein